MTMSSARSGYPTAGLLLAAGFVLALIGQPACGIIPPDSGGEGGSGGTASSSCDDKDNCAQCTACAQDGVCRTELATCQNDSWCLGLDQCIQLCGGMVQCEDDCFAMNSPGVAAYVTLRDCIYCSACSSDCAGQTTCE